MKMFVGIIALLASSAAVAAPSVNQSCWDGSFAYRNARAITTELGLEVTLTGQTFEIPTLWDSWTHAIKAGANSSVHILIPSDALVEKDGVVTASVKAHSDNTPIEVGFPSAVYPQLWLEHRIRGLNGSNSLLTPIDLDSAQVTVSSTGISVAFQQAYKGGANPAADNISVGCQVATAPSNVAFPKALVDHLSK